MTPELIFIERVASPAAVVAPNMPRLALPFERRQIARQRVVLVAPPEANAPENEDSNIEAGLKLPRGTLLRDGDVLRSADNHYARVKAAPEQVSVVRCDSALDLGRAAYHLGNRHVWVQVGDHWLRYLHDHVLDEMLIGLGMSVHCETAPFEPEAGAYSTGSNHSHSHSHA